MVIDIILGFIIGFLTATLIVVTLIFLKNPIEQKTTIIQKQIANKGPRPRGFIVEPTSEAEETRANIIAKNKSLGKDTPINELL